MARNRHEGLTYRQIETSKEARLWLGQIILPAAGIWLLCPELREFVKDKAREGANAVKVKARKVKDKIIRR